MKKFYRFAILIFIGLFIFANTSCSFFGAIGRIFVNVRNGESPAGQNSFIMSAYLFDASEGVAHDENGNGPQIDRVKAKDLAPGQQDYSFSFANPVREGTSVKVVLCLKTKNTVDDNNPSTVDQKKYFTTSATFVVQEGVNTPTFPAFTEVNVNNAWWYMD